MNSIRDLVFWKSGRLGLRGGRLLEVVAHVGSPALKWILFAIVHLLNLLAASFGHPKRQFLLKKAR